jgi:hypothetical protein
VMVTRHISRDNIVSLYIVTASVQGDISALSVSISVSYLEAAAFLSSTLPYTFL